MTRLFALLLTIVGIVLAGAPVSFAQAQTATGIPNAVQGFSSNRDKPININATSLELRDKDKKATFSGAVQVVQGDTVLKCKLLDVYYEQDGAGRGARAGQPGPAGQQQIRRLEAKGGVHVTQKDQTASGDNGIFDLRANTMTLIGNVTITHGQNVVRGDRLVVDLTTGVSRMEGGVKSLFQPSSARDADGRNAEAARPQQRPASQAPLKLN
jgi:lipopolysaccharide export system protein LptA